MTNAGYNVIRCPACSTCHGRKGSALSCPHCGQNLKENGILVMSVTSAEDLRREVTLANTPPELRDMLRSRILRKEPLSDFNQETPSRIIGRWVQESCEDDGSITVHSIQQTLNRNHSDLDANEVIEQAEVQGMLLRLDAGRWMLLE
jgi:hypothetical protein